MRTSVRVPAAVGLVCAALLLSACGAGLDAAAGRSTAARAQATIRELYDAVVAAVGGEPMSGRGSFTNCGVGSSHLHWVFSGYLDGARSPDLRDRVGAALSAAGFEPAPTSGDRSKFTRDGLAVVVQTPPPDGGLEVLAETPCEGYTSDAADALAQDEAWTYGKPLR